MIPRPDTGGGGGGGSGSDTSGSDSDSGGSSGGSSSDGPTYTTPVIDGPTPVSGGSGDSSDSGGSSDESDTLDDGSSSDGDSSASNEDSDTNMDDPFDAGGKTGSEIIAEAGGPEAVATIDPHADSVEDVVAEHGAEGAFSRLVDLAQDGSDPNDAGVDETFDHADEEDVQETAHDLAQVEIGLSDLPENMATEGGWPLGTIELPVVGEVPVIGVAAAVVALAFGAGG